MNMIEFGRVKIVGGGHLLSFRVHQEGDGVGYRVEVILYRIELD